MTARRPHRAQRTTGREPLQTRAPRRTPLPPGQLDALIEAHLRAFPHLDFSATELANVLGRSHGGVAKACRRLIDNGLAIQTQPSPRRFQAAPSDPTGNSD